MNDIFDDIAAIDRWIDRNNLTIPGDDEMRIMKIGEELGEVVAAYIGMTGQNPRKGITHDMSDVCTELADVAITALCAIAHFNSSRPEITRMYVKEKIAKIISRSDIS